MTTSTKPPLRALVPEGHPQFEAVKAEVASAGELAEELNVPVEEILAQRYLNTREAMRLYRDEVNYLLSELRRLHGS